MSEFVRWLREKVSRVAAMEREAKALLAGRDPEPYINLMREKAGLLAGLAEEGEDKLSSLPLHARRPVKERLRGFSRSAHMALELDSVFFMSALLYPEDHREGQPNDLELFLEEVRAKD